MTKKRGHRRIYYLFPESSGVYKGKEGIHCETVEAYTTCTPGLIVTRKLGSKKWNLTHEGMGLAIVVGTTRHAAYYFAGALGAIFEWDKWDTTNHKVRQAQCQIQLKEIGLYEWATSLARSRRHQ